MDNAEKSLPFQSGSPSEPSVRRHIGNRAAWTPPGKIKEENPMRINTNLTAMNTYAQYTKNQSKISSAVAKLSSGYAINTAADNAAGLAISEKMRAQIRGLDKASSNAQDAISLVQTAEGALSSSTEILQRMREIAVQSSSDTNNDSIDRTALQDEFSQLQGELDSISSNTTFNKKNLLDGSWASTSKSVSTATLGNTSMAVTLGNAAAGDYEFNVSVKQESAGVVGAKPTDYSATLGSTATGYFEAAGSTATGSGYLTNGMTSAVHLGANASASSILNGNYSLAAASNNDGSLTVTATGDNGQSFTANVTSEQLANLATASATGTTELDLKFNASADDAFTLALGVKDFSNTDNGITALSSAIKDTTVSVSGGVTAQAATYGVYAELSGGSSVKLNTGDSSVTFDNGVTFSFNKLTASDLDTANKGTLTSATIAVDGVSALTSGNVSGLGSGGTLDVTTESNDFTNFKSLDSSTVADGAFSGNLASTYNSTTKITTFTVRDSAANVYTATLKDSDMGTASVTTDASGAGTGTFATKTLTFSDSTGNAAFTADLVSSAAVVNGTASTTGTISYTGATSAGTAANTVSMANSGHNYSKVFGDGTTTDLTNKGDSSFTVSASANEGITFQVGANEGDMMSINIEKMDAQTLGVTSAKVDTQAAASAAIKSVDSAINAVSAQRATLGAIQNRLQYKIDNLGTSSTNLTSAESQIRDVDMAKQMTEFTNANILSQAATAMLAQANSLPQSVLSLIGK
jgi:flagellin